MVEFQFISVKPLANFDCRLRAAKVCIAVTLKSSIATSWKVSFSFPTESKVELSIPPLKRGKSVDADKLPPVLFELSG